MAAAFLKKLKEDLARLEVQIAKLGEDAEHFRRVIAFYERQAETSEEGATQAPAVKALTNEMMAIFQEEGGPLHYVEVYNRLRQRGIAVPGKEPSRNVNAHMSSDPRFENVGRGMWDLRSRGGKQTEESRVLTTSDVALRIAPASVPDPDRGGELEEQSEADADGFRPVQSIIRERYG